MTMPHQTTEHLEAEIAAQRADLAQTVDQLAHKLDVKAQARERIDRIGPRDVAVASAAVVLIGVVLWWRRR